jgi:DNA invertase Pin-like site-specific DNA recombinase
MTNRAAIYLRTSFALSATAEEQARDLRQLAADRGWAVVAIHRDNGAVGARSAERRPGLAALLNGIKNGSYDIVLVETLSLLGCDLAGLLSILGAVKAAGNVRLIARLEGIDTSESGDGLLDAAQRFAEHVRFGKRERVLAGQRRAREAGVKFGRPSIPKKQIARVKSVLETGAGIREAGRLTGVSATSVFRIRDGIRAGSLEVGPGHLRPA